ncbi:MAG: hypothetical protein LAN63_15190 [Acidobacteriia bacterium]|nr:hypothetical protein [Terriglobia bacterium]
MPATDLRVDALRKAPLDSWIALSDDETRIVAVGKSYSEVASELDRLGDEHSVILKTPTAWIPLAI